MREPELAAPAQRDTPAAADIKTLADLRRGDAAFIEDAASLPAQLALLRAGLLKGDRIEVTDVAPGGSPIAIVSGATKIALRRNDARAVRVRPA